MIKTLCDHAQLAIPALLAVAAGMGGVSLWWLKRYIRGRDDDIRKIMDKLELSLSNHDDCQKSLPEKYATRSDVTMICSKIDKLTEVVSQFHYVFRTKDEANREWRLLEQRLSTIEGNIKSLGEGNAERHREIWDKLNRVVDFFKDERTKIEKQLEAAVRR